MSSPYEDPLLYLEITIVSGLYGLLGILYGNFIGLDILLNVILSVLIATVAWGIFAASSRSIRMRASMDILLFVLMGINVVLFIAVWKYIGYHGRDLVALWILTSLVTSPFSQIAEKIGVSVVNPSKFYLVMGLILFWGGLALKFAFLTIDILDYVVVVGGLMLEFWGSVRGLRVE